MIIHIRGNTIRKKKYSLTPTVQVNGIFVCEPDLVNMGFGTD